MPLLTTDELAWRTLTGVINRIDQPFGFFSRMFGGNDVTHEDDMIEHHIRTGSRKMGQFVKKGSRAMLLKGEGYSREQFTFPTIKYKMSFEPHKYLKRPAPGVISKVLGSSGGAKLASARTLIQQDMEEFDRTIANQIEWMCAQAFTEGKIIVDESTGATEGTDAFEYDFQRSAANTISATLTADNWNNKASSVSTADPSDLIRAGKIRGVAANGGIAGTTLVMGKNVGAAFNGNTIVRANLDPRRLNQAGPILLGGDVREEGLVYEGAYAGVECFTLDRTIDILGEDLSVAVSGVDLIDPDSAYLFSPSYVSSVHRIDYGPIEDWETMQTGKLAMKRYAKAWTEGGDNTVGWEMVETRPLPRPVNDPDAVVVLKPLAGSG